ncbi:MAG: TetR/AcrR family transcriptional regulator [Desulfobacterales bacterium]|jgi:TetR/AcrR family fatty acid metabolism transcriptional regulator|nr:TetR/AcrR family transcriptional regulator [Desulfobacterales bacterium]
MSPKRIKIIQSAEKVFSKKGATAATISEIAKKAGVSDAIIYQHFKGKEDLLHSIPYERLQELINRAEEALQGINHIESCLRKLFWCHLSFFAQHKELAKILILQCRPSDHFYTTPAYEVLQKYESIIAGILQNGVREGIFREDIPMSFVQDAIIGMLDFETLGIAVTGETADPMANIDDMIAMIHAMISKSTVSVQQISTEDKILIAAEKVFDAKGFLKATMSEIASAAGVAEGTVYDYFANKDQLMISIPKKRIERYYTKVEELFHATRPATKLERYIQFIFSFFLKDYEISKVFYQILLSQQFYASDGYKSFQHHFGVIEDIVTEGVKTGDFRPNANARLFRNMFMGICTRFAISWFILEQPADKIKQVNMMTELLISSIST